MKDFRNIFLIVLLILCACATTRSIKFERLDQINRDLERAQIEKFCQEKRTDLVQQMMLTRSQEERLELLRLARSCHNDRRDELLAERRDLLRSSE